MNFTLNVVLGGEIAVVLKPAPEESPLSPTTITSTFEGFTTRTRTDTMAYKLTAGKQIGLKIEYTDKLGNPTDPQSIAWGSSNDAISSVAGDTADDNSAKIQGLAVGDAQINATADVDLGDGVKELITTFDVSVVAGEAVAGSISVVGEQEDIPVEGGGGGEVPPPVEIPGGRPPHPDQSLPGQPETPYPDPQKRR